MDNLMDLYNSIHPEFLASSSFIMQRGFFNQVAKMKDSNGHYYMQNGVINGKLTYTLFGAEVIESFILATWLKKPRCIMKEEEARNSGWMEL